MSAMFFLAVFIGIAAVGQGGLNKQLMMKWGLFEVGLLNNIIVLAISIAAYFLAQKYSESLPLELRNKGNLLNIPWWIFIPGIFGASIVLGIPFAFFKFGALKVFIVLVSTQIVASMLWDYFVEHIHMGPIRVASALIAFISVVLMAFDKHQQL